MQYAQDEIYLTSGQDDYPKRYMSGSMACDMYPITLSNVDESEGNEKSKSLPQGDPKEGAMLSFDLCSQRDLKQGSKKEKNKKNIRKLMKADAKIGADIGSKVYYFVGAIPGMAIGAASGSIIGVLGGAVVMPIGKPLTQAALKVVPGSYTSSEEADLPASDQLVLLKAGDKATDEIIFKIAGEDVNVALQSLMVDASSCGGQGALFGAEVGGHVTGEFLAVPGMIFGGLIGGLYGLVDGVAEYAKQHNAKYSEK